MLLGLRLKINNTWNYCSNNLEKGNGKQHKQKQNANGRNNNGNGRINGGKINDCIMIYDIIYTKNTLIMLCFIKMIQIKVYGT